MDVSELVKQISFKLSSVAFTRLGKERNYSNVISNFTRLYLLTDGEAMIQMGKNPLPLRKGYLYLIPSLTHCSYACPEFMEQYYATFTVQLPNNMSIYQLFDFRYEIKATPAHYEMFHRLLEENKGLELPAGDPEIYQKRDKLGVRQGPRRDAQNILRSSAYLNLFLSDFIRAPRINLETENRMSESISYIHSNLDKELGIESLAGRMNMSPDHYTRRFKELTRQTPNAYINRQKIEKAQLLINTTSQSITDISFQCGYKSNTYFCRVFKKYTGLSPRQYRFSSNDFL